MATITQLATIVTAFRCPETPHSHVLRLDTSERAHSEYAVRRHHQRYPRPVGAACCPPGNVSSRLRAVFAHVTGT